VSGGCARSPIPVLEIHGGSDPDVHYTGDPGEGGMEPAITDW
jgi:poly(3-hydroxybutyrate) depolymerase